MTGGRGPDGSTRPVASYTLMNRTHPVLRFRYEASTGTFLTAGEVIDAARAPVGVLAHHASSVNVRALGMWWRYRSIPRFREGISEKLDELGFQSTHQIPFRSLGLSLADQYWVRPDGVDVAWEDINYFHNDFGLADVGAGWLEGVGGSTPNNTLEGELPKLWLCKDGRRVLVKGGGLTGNQQPYNELAATALFRRLLEPGEYVSYELEDRGGRAVSVCEAFVADDEELVCAQNVMLAAHRPFLRSEYHHYLACCQKLGGLDARRALAKMIVCDFILANTDRHWRNFGLVRNVETLEWRIAPLFDTGTSLWCTASVERMVAGDWHSTAKPFHDEPDRQLRMVHDFSWLDPRALDGFPDEVAEILSANPEMAPRVDAVRSAVRDRIAKVLRRL